MKRVVLEPSYILHRRSYRETSFLVDIFTQHHGRLTLLARGVRKSNSATSGLLQPFTPLLISWSGKGELMTLNQVDMNGEVRRLQGNCLFAGFYLNELLMQLVHRFDPHPGLYFAYEKAITDLQTETLNEKPLRSFEKYLLEELGYGLLPKSDRSLHNSLSPDQYYRFIHEQGFVPSEREDEKDNPYLFSGRSLIAIMNEDWEDEDAVQDAKRLTRFILAPLLGKRPLHSRRLFTEPKEMLKK